MTPHPSMAIVESLGWTLLHFAWQGGLIGCAAALALTVLRNARPETRYGVACTGMLACLAWPAVELALRLADLHGAMPDLRHPSQLARGGALFAQGSLLGFLHAHLAPLVALWALCALALALRMASGLLWIRRAARAVLADQAWQERVALMARQFGVKRSVTLRIVDGLASPITAGWWRPVILVPAALLTGMPPALLEALLAHEMAHVRRFDYLVNLVQHVVEILLFYHPAVWWLSRRIRAERELIADDMAACHLGAPRRLALALSELERVQFSGSALALGADGGDLLARVQRLLRPQRAALNWSALLPAAAIVAACVTVYAHAGAGAAPVAALPMERHAMANFNSCSKPVWPAASLKAEHTGAVILNFKIDADGKVIDSRLKKSSGHPLLDEAARVGIMKCSFFPALSQGQPVTAWMQMQYSWVLK